MKCPNVRKKLVAYIDDELSTAEVHSIEAHLAECAQCTVVYKQLGETVEWANQIKPIEPTQDWSKKLQKRIHKIGSEPDLLRSEKIPVVPKSSATCSS